MATKDEVAKAVARELERFEIKSRIEHHGAKHPRIIWDVNGRTFAYPFSRHANDRRAPRNAVADIRRILRRAGVLK